MPIESGVVSSNEKTLQSMRNGRIRLYRPVGARYDSRCANNNKVTRSSRFPVNVWGCITLRGPDVCVALEEMSAKMYRSVLEQFMFPYVELIFGKNYMTIDNYKTVCSWVCIITFNRILFYISR